MDFDADEAADPEFESEAVSARVQFDLGRTKTSSADSNGQEGLVYPALFISHGTPALVLQADDPTHVFPRRLGTILPKPQYVIAVSAHWECNIPTVTASSQPAIVHDYLGFPQSLYELHYQLRGCPSMAADICQTLLEVVPSQPCLHFFIALKLKFAPGRYSRRSRLAQGFRPRGVASADDDVATRRHSGCMFFTELPAAAAILLSAFFLGGPVVSSARAGPR